MGGHEGFHKAGKHMAPTCSPAHRGQPSAQEEAAALVFEGPEKRRDNASKRVVSLQVWAGVALVSPRHPGPKDCRLGGGVVVVVAESPPWSHTNLNALQVPPLSILCWFRENEKQT